MTSLLETFSGITLYLFSPFYFNPIKFVTFFALPSSDYALSYARKFKSNLEQKDQNLPQTHVPVPSFFSIFNFRSLSLLSHRLQARSSRNNEPNLPPLLPNPPNLLQLRVPLPPRRTLKYSRIPSPLKDWSEPNLRSFGSLFRAPDIAHNVSALGFNPLNCAKYSSPR
jgi:hypothetical protein